MARLFDDSASQYLEVGSAVVTGVPATLAAWGYTDTSTGEMYLVAVADGAGSNQSIMRIGLFDLTVVGHYIDSGGNFGSAFGGGPVSVNTWFHLAIVCATTSSRTTYLNGVQAAVGSTSIIDTFTPTRTAIGVVPMATRSGYWSGRIAEVGIWNATLSVPEIGALARGALPIDIRPDSLVSYAPVWGVHSPEIDLRTPSLSWAVTGATAAPHAPVVPFSQRFWRNSFPGEAAPAAGILRQMMAHHGG